MNRNLDYMKYSDTSYKLIELKQWSAELMGHIDWWNNELNQTIITVADLSQVNWAEG